MKVRDCKRSDLKVGMTVRYVTGAELGKIVGFSTYQTEDCIDVRWAGYVNDCQYIICWSSFEVEISKYKIQRLKCLASP